MRKGVLALWLVAAVILALPLAEPARAQNTTYQTGFARWRGADGDFQDWQRAGIVLNPDGGLRLDPVTAHVESDPFPAGSCYGHSFYNGGTYLAGEALGPVTPTPFGFDQAIASWNADTPVDTWIETLIRARRGDRWTKWYNLGVWAAYNLIIERHSVDRQGDADGYVDTDVLILAEEGGPADAFQVKVRLFSADGIAIPHLRNLSVAFSTTPPQGIQAAPGDPTRWDRVLPVPQCSQMVYPDGGDVWCSPTATSMVLAYWLQDPFPCRPRVPAAAAAVYDWLYEGHGNWPFNTAYAASWHSRGGLSRPSRGPWARSPRRRARRPVLEAYVARFSSLAEAEQWIAAGVPVIVSIAWDRQELTGAPLPVSGGHLAALVGFDAAGDPVVNDPAAPTDDTVQRTYLREEFERLWLEWSGGTAYLIYPPTWPIPSL